MGYPAQPSAVNFTSLPETLSWRALHQPEKIIFTWLNYLDDNEHSETTLTYAEIDKRAKRIGTHLQSCGAEGNRALLLYPPGLDYIVAFLGCLYAGAIAVPAYPPFTGRLLRRLQSIVSDSEAGYVLTTASARHLMASQLEKDIQLRNLNWIDTDGLEAEIENGYKVFDIDPKDLAFLQYTSGSTADPKGSMITHANLSHNLESMHAYFAGTTDNVGISWLPQYHDMGLVGCILASLFSDVPTVSMSPLDFLHTPFRWLEAISRYRGTISGAPNFAYDLCIRRVTDAQRNTLDLSCWDIAGNAAEPVRADTIERFSRMFASCGFREGAFKPGYGLAESTFMATKIERGTPPAIRQFKKSAHAMNQVVEASRGEERVVTLVGCGKALPQSRIVIVNPDSLKACPPDTIGEVWVSGPSVAQGYWNRTDDTGQVFCASLSDTGEGPFLRTGDLGFLQDDALFLAGRIKDLIIIHGRNHYPQDIEKTIESSHTALRPGCTAAFSLDVQGQEKLSVIQEIKKTHTHTDTNFNDIYAAIQRSIQQEHALDVYDIVLISAGTISKTSSGKIQRRACRNAYLKNQLKVIGRYRNGFEKQPSGGPGRGSFAAPSVAGIQTPLVSIISQIVRNPDTAKPNQIIETVIRQILSPLLNLDPDDMKADVHLDEYGMSSLQMVEMDDHLLHLFGVRLSSEEWKKEISIRRLTKILLSKSRVQKAVEARQLFDLNSAPGPAVHESQEQIPSLLNTRELLLLDIFKWFSIYFWRLDIQGLQNLGLTAPFIICPNHESHLDSFVVACSLPRAQRRRLCTFTAREVFDNYFQKELSRTIRSIPADRYGDQRPVLKTGEKLIRMGRHLLIFPEGKRTRDGSMNPFLGGAAYLSHKTGAPIIPAFIKGTRAIYPPEKKRLPYLFHPYLKKMRIKLAFGPPLTADGQGIQAFTQQIYQSVVTLKKDHP